MGQRLGKTASCLFVWIHAIEKDKQRPVPIPICRVRHSGCTQGASDDQTSYLHAVALDGDGTGWRLPRGRWLIRRGLIRITKAIPGPIAFEVDHEDDNPLAQELAFSSKSDCRV